MTTIADAVPANARALLRPARQPPWVQPMLATLSERRDLDAEWVFERKLDGIRALAFKRGDDVRLFSRNKLSLNAQYPDVVEAVRAQAIDECILDGEVVASRGKLITFELLQQARAGGGRERISFHVFDVLHAAGYDTTQLPLLARKRLLRAVLTPGTALRTVAAKRGDATTLLEQACAGRWEGLIAKRADGAYVHGRSKEWLKLKCSAEQEFVVGGFSDPKGSRVGFGALLLGTYEGNDLRYAGEVGTGFNHGLLRELGERLRGLEREASPFVDFAKPRKGIHWVEPRIVVQVGFTEWTRDGRLRHPRFLGERTDKAPRDVVREAPSP